MANTTYNLLDDDGVLFLVNYLFTKLKNSPLNNNTTYTLSKNSSTNVVTLTGSDGSTTTFTDSDTTYTDATSSASGLMSSADFTKLAGIQNGAQENLIESISVNGTAVTITSKNVNITIPTNVSSFTNDSGYQNATQVNSAITTALADITGISFEKVASYGNLPAVGVKGVIYLVPKTGTTNDVYDEYFWVQQDSKYEYLGTTQVDLTNYVQYSDISTITNAEITNIVDDAYSDVFS